MTGRIFNRCNAATMLAGTESYGLIEDAAIAVCDGAIVWAAEAELSQLASYTRPRHDTDNG